MSINKILSPCYQIIYLGCPLTGYKVAAACVRRGQVFIIIVIVIVLDSSRSWLYSNTKVVMPNSNGHPCLACKRSQRVLKWAVERSELGAQMKVVLLQRRRVHPLRRHVQPSTTSPLGGREEQIALQPRRSRRWAIGADIHSRARDGDPAFKFSRRTMHEASSTHMTKSGSQTQVNLKRVSQSAGS